MFKAVTLLASILFLALNAHASPISKDVYIGPETKRGWVQSGIVTSNNSVYLISFDNNSKCGDLLKSADDGKTWHQIDLNCNSENLTSAPAIFDFSESRAGILGFLRKGSDGSKNFKMFAILYLSSDQGETWTQIDVLKKLSLDLPSTAGVKLVQTIDSLWILIKRGGFYTGEEGISQAVVYRSKDRGLTWSEDLRLGAQNSLRADLAINQQDQPILTFRERSVVIDKNSNVRLTGEGPTQIYFRNDEGWQKISEIDSKKYQAYRWSNITKTNQLVLSNNLFSPLKADQLGLIQSNDGGRTWTSLSISIPEKTAYIETTTDSNWLSIAGPWYGYGDEWKISQSFDFGRTWSVLHQDNSVPQGWQSVTGQVVLRTKTGSIISAGSVTKLGGNNRYVTVDLIRRFGDW